MQKDPSFHIGQWMAPNYFKLDGNLEHIDQYLVSPNMCTIESPIITHEEGGHLSRKASYLVKKRILLRKNKPLVRFETISLILENLSYW